MAINNAPAGSCIWVAEGDYFTSNGTNQAASFDIKKSLTLLGGFDGTETCLSQRAGKFQRTILSGGIGMPTNLDNAHHVIQIVGPFDFGNPPDIVIDGFTIMDAYSVTENGGGILCHAAGSLRLQNCWIVDNVAGNGGGAYVTGTKLEVLDCTIARNLAEFDGGGFWASAVSSKLVPGSGAHVYNTRIANNGADNGLGGGVYLTGITAHVEFMNCTVLNNTAPFGGGFGLVQSGKAFIHSSTVTGNTATTGAAMFAAPSTGCDGDFYNSILWDNAPGPTAVDGDPNDFAAVYTTVEEGMLFDCTPSPDCTNVGLCTTWSCDPVFAGGLTLRCGQSPAIDSGDSALMPNDVFDVDGDGDTTEDMPFDKVGDDRVQDGGSGMLVIDRGAFETCTP